MDILMKSNLLQLQTTELLNSIDASSKLSKKKVREWVQKVKEVLLDSKSKQSLHDREISGNWVEKQGYSCLVPSTPYSDKDLSISYQVPQEVSDIGSNASDTTIAPFYNIDLAVMMPADLFETKDVLNHVYFDKRRLYLAGIWKTLQIAQKRLQGGDNSAEPVSLYSDIIPVLFKADERKPILHIRPPFPSPIVLRLIPTLPAHGGGLKLSMLRNSRNNVRPLDWMDKLRQRRANSSYVENTELDPSTLPPTPMYNHAILEDMTPSLYATLLSTVLATGQGDGIKAGLRLFKLWLFHRGLSLYPAGFDACMAGLVVAYLVGAGKVSASLS
eukprot:gene27540-33264_t